MAISFTTNYNGDVYPAILGQMLSENTIVNGGHLYVQEVVDKFHVPRFELSNVIQDHKAEIDIVADPVGDVTHDEITLQPKEFMVFMKFNPRSYESYWKKYQPQGALVFKSLPAELQIKILSKLTNQVSHKLGYLALNGDTANTVSTYRGAKIKYFDGLIKRMKSSRTLPGGAAEAAVKIGATTTGGGGAEALTVANIEAKMDLVKSHIMSNESVRWTYEHPSFKYFMSVVDADKWSIAQRKALYKGAGLTEKGIMQFDGKPIVALEGIPANTIFATVATPNESSNLWVGVNTVADEDTLVIDRTASYNETYFIKMLIDMDTQIKYLNEVVLYDPTLA